MTPLIKKTLLFTTLGLGGVILFVFSFGSLDPLSTNIKRPPQITRLEALPPEQPSLSKTNITESVATLVAGEIVAQNPDGPKSVEGEQVGLQTIDPGKLTEETLAKAFAEVNIEDLRPKITLQNLIIIKSTEKALAEAYFKNIGAMVTENFPAGTSINWDDPARTNFTALIDAYDRSMNEGLAIAVPQDLAELHRRYLSLLGAERNTLTLIKNYQLDPAQATVAIEAGNQFTTELLRVLTEMDSYVATHNLKITS